MRGIVKIAIGLCVALVAIGLVFPSLSRVREAAANIRCRNNLKQIALAVHNYEDTQGSLPQGTFPNDRLEPEQRLGWQFAILPYIESNSIYRRANKELSWDAPENEEILLISYKLFLCLGEGKSNAVLPVTTNYVGLAGLSPKAAFLPKDSPLAGVFGFERKINKEDIKDGTSNTILAIETSVELGPWAAGGNPTVRFVDFERQPYLGVGRPFGGIHSGDRKWFSKTPTIANVAFLNGSVRPLKDTIDPHVFEALVTIAGEEEVPEEY